MIRKLNEGTVAGYTDVSPEAEHIYRMIGRVGGRFGYRMEDKNVHVNTVLGGLADEEREYLNIQLTKNHFPTIIVESYFPYDEACVRIKVNEEDFSSYTYGRGKGEVRMTVRGARDFRNALTTAIELCSALEGYFESVV